MVSPCTDTAVIEPPVALGFATVKAVLPPYARKCALGGIQSDTLFQWLEPGTDGFDIGRELYKPGMTVADVSESAHRIITNFEKALQ